MKRAVWPCGSALLAALVGAASLTVMEPAIGADATVREVRAVTPFNRVVVDAPAELLITQGSAESLEVEAEARVLPLLRTRVDNLTLTIGVAGSLHTSLPIRVHLGLRTLDLLRAEGAADVRIGALRTPALSMQLAGSSRARVSELTSGRADVQLAGASEMQVERGRVHRQLIRIDDAAQYDAAGLSSDEVQIDLRGSGQARLHAGQTLDAQLSGSSQLAYSGTPRLTQRLHDAAELRRTSSRQID